MQLCPAWVSRPLGIKGKSIWVLESVLTSQNVKGNCAIPRDETGNLQRNWQVLFAFSWNLSAWIGTAYPPTQLTGSFLWLESIEYGKISNGSIRVLGKEYKVCLNWSLIKVKK